MQITSALTDPALLDLPWELPLEQWPANWLVALPRGISRHVVRFVRLGDVVYAVKETGQRVAEKEYGLLRGLERLDAPAVQGVAIGYDRRAADGQPLDPVLITRHLQFSLPYRALFSHTLRPATMNRLLDALAALLVRLHLTGFFWGDCSLSNTLFRRDAGAFAAYLVDAETGALHNQLSNGQRDEDLELARVNIFGEALDLEAGGYLHPSIDPEWVSEQVVDRYEGLWHEITYEQVIGRRERHKLESRIRRLNDLGFDVAEMSMNTAEAGDSYRVRPKVVDAGHHSRRLQALTALDAEENQARRLLNDLDTYRVANDIDDEQIAAAHWLTDVFEPVIRAVPAEMCGKLEAPELFHQLLDHRWYMSEEAGLDVGMHIALISFLDNVLSHRRDEQAVLGADGDDDDLAAPGIDGPEAEADDEYADPGSVRPAARG